VLSINGRATDALEHEDAKRAILMSGDAVNLRLQRGAVSIWKPKVTPLSELRPAAGVARPAQPPGDTTAHSYIQHTSLAANKQEPLRIGSSHNRAPKPFCSSQNLNGNITDNSSFSSHVGNSVSAVVHSQYNTPLPLYDRNVATEVHEAKQEQLTDKLNTMNISPPVKVNNVSPPEAAVPGFRSVRAPDLPTSQPNVTQPQHPTCALCSSLIIGVFVRIKGQPMHAECFKCKSCGINLKQKGYFMVEGDLHCEICAREVSKPPEPNMVVRSAVFR
jgi:hypothetical protein